MSYEAYWIKRAEQRIAERQAYMDASLQQIGNVYSAAMKEINKSINRIFLQFVSSGGMSRQEAEKLLKEKITDKELERLKGKISRREALQHTIMRWMSETADRELEITTEAYTRVIREEYYRNIFDSQQYLGAAFSFQELPEKVIEEILKNNWSGKHYSERIWGNTEVMARQIEEVILKGAMMGTNSRKMAKELDGIADTGMYACERLIRTETTYFTAMADIEAAKARGTEAVRFVATLDKRTSPRCREADGSIIPVQEAVPGKNIPPLHPFCRSIIIDVGRGLVHKVRRARDPVTGENVQVPADMKYKEWAELPLQEKKVDFGNVHDVTFRKMAGETNLSREQIEEIQTAIAGLSEEYNIKLDYFEVGNYTGEKYTGVPFFYRAIDEDGIYKSKFVINNACIFWTDAQVRTEWLGRTVFQGKTIEDLVNHEMAHVMTFQGCRSMDDYLRLEAEIHPLYSCGVSEYALLSRDGAEAVAEAFVKQRQKKAVNLRSHNLLDKYVEVWRK